ncbi:MAG: SAM-dependent chlorinase/fluorinase [Phototrophicaceae bacterium]
MGKLIALITDFGTSDIYVGVMKAVMKKIHPSAEFIDISHEVKRQSIHDGAFMLRNAYQYFPKDTVFLVVIDPTVGSKRRPILVETEDYCFIAPDNGILTPLLADIDNWQAVELSNTAYHLTDGSFTFHGRDIFSPVAAYVARGDIALDDFGQSIADLVQLPIPSLSITDTVIKGEVTHIDHFGNIITNIGTLHRQSDTQLELRTKSLNKLIEASSAHIIIGDTRIDTIQTAYHKVAIGELLLQVDSNGYLEIAINQGSASQRLEVSLHDTIVLKLLL